MDKTATSSPARPRRLRPAAGLRKVIAPALVIVVAGTLLGVVTIGVLSLSHQLDRQRRAQIALARISHLVDAVRFQPSFYLGGPSMPEDAVAGNLALRQQLLGEATTLSDLSPLGRPVLKATKILNAAIVPEVAALRIGDIGNARDIDAGPVARAYDTFGSDTPDGATTQAVSDAGLLTPTRKALDRQVREANRNISRAMVGEIVGAGLLIITLTTIGGVLRRRRALRDTERLAQHAAAEHQAALLRNSSDLILVTDTDGVVTYASPASETMLGVTEADVVGTPARELVHPDDQHVSADVLRCFQTGTKDSAVRQVRLRNRDGSYRQVEICFTNLLRDPIVQGIVANVRDISERSRLEAELRHAQKLESVGQLASGIAHEINTPIQFIGDNVRFLGDAFDDLLREPEQAPDVDRDYLASEVPVAISQTLEGIDRVAGIVRAMKAFGHPGSDEKSPTDINEAVRNTLIVSNNTVKHVADVETELADLPRVWCHPGDINQVLVNLVVNAAHAIADKNDCQRGTIKVRTYMQGPDAVIEVHDTGCGIPEQVANRVFEPFFTTKEVGRGTGQGLSLAYALVTERHDGGISFTARPGGGTIFTVRLPAGTPSAVAEPVA